MCEQVLSGVANLTSVCEKEEKGGRRECLCFELDFFRGADCVERCKKISMHCVLS